MTESLTENAQSAMLNHYPQRQPEQVSRRGPMSPMVFMRALEQDPTHKLCFVGFEERRGYGYSQPSSFEVDSVALPESER